MRLALILIIWNWGLTDTAVNIVCTVLLIISTLFKLEHYDMAYTLFKSKIR